MAKEDVFEKEWVDERDKNNLEGLLEQLNLPPVAVTFVRENKRLVQIAIVLLVLAVVTWSLYGAYQDNRIEKSSEALSAALEQEGQQQLDLLAEVEKEFDGTDAALWARINRAQQLLKNSAMAEAGEEFKSISDDLAKSSILQPLLVFGIAQSAEAEGDFDAAAAEYRKLIEIEGYQDLGYLGAARVHVVQGNKDKALELYENYLASIDAAAVLQKAMVEEKIARIKAAP
jgi:predicted negative regulator of RcsB-dependent stress response